MMEIFSNIEAICFFSDENIQILGNFVIEYYSRAC